MATKKKMQDGGPADTLRPKMTVKSKMIPKPGAGYKSTVKGPGREGRPASKGYDAYKRDAIEKAGGEDNARQAGYIKQKGGTMKKMQSGGTSGGYPTTGGGRKMQDGGPSVSEKGAFYPDAKCKAEGCPKNPNNPKYKQQVAKLSSADKKKIGAKYMTGGMVNSNAKVQALKSAGSKGVKPGVNPKAAASKVAKGRSGGTSVAPKTAIPKAKYGMTLKKKEDGGPSNAADAMIAQQLKSRAVQKGMNQARVAAKKGRAGKI